MTYHLLSNNEVVYEASTQASSSLALVANQTIYVDPTFNMTGDSFITLNSIIFARPASENPLGISQTRHTLPVQEWETYFDSLVYPSHVVGQYAKHVYAHLQYTLANMPNTFGLSTADWTMIDAPGSL